MELRFAFLDNGRTASYVSIVVLGWATEKKLKWIIKRK